MTKYILSIRTHVGRLSLSDVIVVIFFKKTKKKTGDTVAKSSPYVLVN